MLSKLFYSPARIDEIRCNPSAKLLEALADYLFENGYSRISACRHIRSAEHLIHWARSCSLSMGLLDDSALEHFRKHLARCRCGRYSRAHPVNVLTGARSFCRFSQGFQVPAVRYSEPVNPQPALL